MNAVEKILKDMGVEPKTQIDIAGADLSDFWTEALETMPFIVDHIFPVDVGVFYGPGGEGKSTVIMWLTVLYVLGREVLGRKVLIPGTVLWISGEDPKRRFIYRLKKICTAMKLSDEEIATVAKGIKYVDMSANPIPMASKDASGNLNTTDFAKQFHEAFKGENVRWIVVDPLASFNPSEQAVNDGLQRVITAVRQLTELFYCFTSIVHHVNKASALSGDINLESMRGGTALSGGVRFAMQVATYREAGKCESGYTPSSVSREHYEAGGSVTALHITKIQDASLPVVPFWLSRIGWEFELHKTEVRGSNPEDVAKMELGTKQDQIRTIQEFLRKHPDRHYSKTELRGMGAELTEFGKVKMPAKDSLLNLINVAIAEKQLLELNLPAGEIRGNRKFYVSAPETKF